MFEGQGHRSKFTVTENIAKVVGATLSEALRDFLFTLQKVNSVTNTNSSDPLYKKVKV